jgi:ketosteroid isomerase-like protein
MIVLRLHQLDLCVGGDCALAFGNRRLEARIPRGARLRLVETRNSKDINNGKI